MMNHWETMAWARRVRTGHPGRKAVLLVLAEFADEHDSCFPSQALIAEAIEVSVRTVRDRLAELEAMGAIRREVRGKPGGGRTSDRYILQTKAANLAALPNPLLRQSGENPDQSGDPSPVRSGDLLPTNTKQNYQLEKVVGKNGDGDAAPAADEDEEKDGVALSVEVVAPLIAGAREALGPLVVAQAQVKAAEEST